MITTDSGTSSLNENLIQPLVFEQAMPFRKASSALQFGLFLVRLLLNTTTSSFLPVKEPSRSWMT